MTRSPLSAIVDGGGVAALETMLVLHVLAVRVPFPRAHARSHPMAEIAAECGEESEHALGGRRPRSSGAISRPRRVFGEQ
jgi:hypothetical protein